MRHMRIGEKYAARPYDGFRPAALGARIHRHAFANEAVLADDQTGRFAAILEILRLVSDRREREDAGARADRRLARETDMRHQPHAVAQRGLRSDVTERPDRDIRPEPRAIFDDCRGMDASAHSRTSIADTSASQTSAPSTFASPRNHHMLRRLAVRVMKNFTWSPGTTGLRNFALSIVIR